MFFLFCIVSLFYHVSVLSPGPMWYIFLLPWHDIAYLFVLKVPSKQTNKQSTQYILRTPMARYSLFVLKVPLNMLNKQTMFLWRSLWVSLRLPEVCKRRTVENCRCEIFTDKMLFLSPSQQCLSTEGITHSTITQNNLDNTFAIYAIPSKCIEQCYLARLQPWCWSQLDWLSLHFSGHFPRGPGLASIRMLPFWIFLS